MTNKRKSFLLHIDSLDILDELTNEQAGLLFKAIKSFQLGEEANLDQMVKIAFSPFKNQFIRDAEKYEKTCKARAEAGSKGGKQKVANASKCKQKIANVADSDSKNKSESKSDSDSKRLKEVGQDTLLDEGFDIFYSAGLVKKSKAQAYKKFKSLAKQMKADPIEFGRLLAADVQARIAKQQFGIDKLHPSTYLNNQRWTDEHEETNNGQPAPTGKQSAAQRQAARIAAEYGYSGGQLGLAEGCGDLRGAVDTGEWRSPAVDVGDSSEQAGSIDCEEWSKTDN